MKSRLAIFFVAIIYIISFRQYANYNSLLKGGGDCWGYYAYLPATFIYHDLDDLTQTIQTREEYNPNSINEKKGERLIVSEAHPYKENTIIKYTNGVALLCIPFFLVAHEYCKITHLYPADGYAIPYNLAICFSTLFYSLIGLWYLRKMLIRYFTDTITSVTLLTIGIGTNLYYFSVLNCGMSHTYLFALYAILIYATDNFYETKKLKDAFLIGFCCGIITLIRPTEIIVMLIPMLWNIYSLDDFKKRARFLLDNYKRTLFILLICFLVNLSQLLYWKILTGKFIYYSYIDEGFDFLHPHIKQGLFSFTNGWLTYTPIMFFSIAGLFFLIRYFKKGALAAFIFLPVHVYLIYSWHCWQYINGFGSRPMVEIYPLLALPFACFIIFVWERLLLKIVIFACLIFFCWINIFQTWQFHHGLIWTEEGNLAFYKAIFLRTSATSESLIAFDCGESQPDTNNIHFTQLLKEEGFEDSVSQNYISDIKKDGKYAYELRNSETSKMKINPADFSIHSGDYIKISCDVYCREMEWNKYKLAVLNTDFFHNGNMIRDKKIRLPSKIDNKENSIWYMGKVSEWAHVSYFIKAPHRFNSGSNEIAVNVWNPGEKAIVVDNIKIELWKLN